MCCAQRKTPCIYVCGARSTPHHMYDIADLLTIVSFRHWYLAFCCVIKFASLFFFHSLPLMLLVYYCFMILVEFVVSIACSATYLSYSCVAKASSSWNSDLIQQLVASSITLLSTTSSHLAEPKQIWLCRCRVNVFDGWQLRWSKPAIKFTGIFQEH